MPTVRMPSSLAMRAMTAAAPVPVPPPMPAAMKTMCEPAICARMSSIASSAAASPISGFEPAPSPSVRLMPSCRRCSALEAASACASVLATTKSTPSSPAAIMLLMALHPAPPTPMTVIRGFRSVSLGSCSLMLIERARPHVNCTVLVQHSRSPCRRFAGPIARNACRYHANPALSHCPTRSRYPVPSAPAWLHATASCPPADATAKSPATVANAGLEHVRRQLDLVGLGNSHGPAKHVGGELPDADEPARASRQHHTLTCKCTKARQVHPLAHQFRGCWLPAAV